MGTTSQKLTYLNDTKTKIRDGINAIGGSLDSDDTFRSYADELESLYGDMPKVSDTGSAITLDGTRPGKMILDYNGDTQQDSTTGKNLLKLKDTINGGLTTKVNDDGSVSVSGTSTGTSAYLDTGETTNIPIGTYTLSIQSPLSANLRIFLYNNGTQFSTVTISAGQTSTLKNTEQVITSYSVLLYGLTANTSYNFTIYPMLETGSSATDFEPYTNGASPNPDYPQEIHNVSGDNTIEICGKNLLNITTTLIANRTNNGITTQVNDNQTVTISGTASSTARYFTSDDDNKIFLKAGTYTISSNSTMPVRLSTKTVSGTSQLVADTFTINEDFYIYNGRFNLTNGTTYNETIWIQLEKGSTATEYEAYTGNSQLISLGVENYLQDEYIQAPEGNTINAILKKGTYTIFTEDGETFGNNIYFKLFDNNGTAITTSGHLTTANFTISFSSSSYYYYGGSSREKIIFTLDNDYKLNIGMTNATGTRKVFVIKGNTPQYVSASPIELNQISTYQDYIYKDNDIWYLHKEIGKWLFDNNSGWSYNSANTIFLNNASVVSGKYLVQSAYCNYYKNVINENITGNSQANSILNNNEFSFRVGTQDRMYIKDTRFTSIEDFNTWLSTNNLIVYYVLATPTDTEITDTTLLEQLETIKRSYDGVTNISQENNDLPFILDVSALKEWE